MPILDKTFSGVNKVIKYLILSCFHVNILYVSVALGSRSTRHLIRFVRPLPNSSYTQQFTGNASPQTAAQPDVKPNGFQRIIKSLVLENPKMLIPGGGMLLPSKSVINQNTVSIKQISQPSVNTMLPPTEVIFREGVAILEGSVALEEATVLEEPLTLKIVPILEKPVALKKANILGGPVILKGEVAPEEEIVPEVVAVLERAVVPE